MTITRYRTGAGVAVCVGGSRFAASRKLAALVLVLCFCLSNALGAQRPGARDPENPNVNSDETFEGWIARKSRSTRKPNSNDSRHLAYRCQLNAICRNSVEELLWNPRATCFSG